MDNAITHHMQTTTIQNGRKVSAKQKREAVDKLHERDNLIAQASEEMANAVGVAAFDAAKAKRDAIALVQPEITVTLANPVESQPEEVKDIILHLLKGREFKAPQIAKNIDDARATIGRMANPLDCAGDRITGSDKKGTVVLWEGLVCRPCKSKTEQRAQAVIKAANALARALAMPKGDTL